MIDNAATVIDWLELQPLEIEGGWFRESYRSSDLVHTRYGPRPRATAIYYLLTPDTFSELHRLPWDETFHFYLGDPVQMLYLAPDGSVGRPVMGSDLIAGQQLQLLVPGGIWQGARLTADGQFALLGTTMSPGFSYDDYQRGERDALLTRFPGAAAEITALTRERA